MNAEPVFLLHGIWLRRGAMAWLGHRLAAQGFAPQRMNYASIRGGPQPAVAALRAQIAAIGQGPVHVVGHSLGGLIALEAVRGLDLRGGRVVCLGSPLCGSHAARGLAKLRLRALAGRSHDILCCGIESWSEHTPVGMIAGSRQRGLGRVIGNLPRPNDGTVAVVETRLQGLADHVVLDASHTGLIFSARAAALAANFLRFGRFA